MPTRPTRVIPTLVLLGTVAGGCQDVRSEKAAFKDVDQWAATKPADVRLKNFRPFRAVYERSYVKADGRNAGEVRTDRVIIAAEEVGWEGRKAALISLIDSADAKWEDTAARNLFMIVDSENLDLLFESGPIPGMAKDYYLLRPDKGVRTMVTTDVGTSQTQEYPQGMAGFGPGVWALASLDLKEGAKVRLDPVISPATTVLRINSVIVKGSREFADLSGKSHSGWLLEGGGNLASSRMVQIYVTDRPPYLLARFSVDLDSGEESRGTRLKSFQYLH